MKKIKAVIFDMDGLIFDSEEHSRRCFVEACEAAGYEYDEQWCLGMIGTVHEDAIRMTVARYGEKGCHEIFDAYRQIFLDGYRLGKVELKPGAWELINALNDISFPICLATSSRMSHVHDSFDNSPFKGIPFEKAITGEAGARSKPDPEAFLKAADLLDIPIENCLILEDSLSGARAAIASGGISCMVPDLLPPDEFIVKNVDFIKKDLYEVIELLKDAAVL